MSYILQGTQTIANFEIYIGCRYDVILKMLWLNDVDACIIYKHRKFHGKHFDSKPFTIKGTKILIKIPLLSTTHIRRCVRKKQEVFAIDIRNISDESWPSRKEPINVEDFLANYQDIFPDEVLWMPPQRKVDHAIKLVPTVAPIA